MILTGRVMRHSTIVNLDARWAFRTTQPVVLHYYITEDGVSVASEMPIPTEFAPVAMVVES